MIVPNFLQNFIMLLSWIVLSFVLNNVPNNLECNAFSVLTKKVAALMEWEFLDRYKDNPDGRMASSLQNDNQRQPADICRAVLNRDVIEGRGEYEKYEWAKFTEETILISHDDPRLTPPQKEWYLDTTVLACPYGEYPVIYIRESPIQGNDDCYLMLYEWFDYLIFFAEARLINEQFHNSLEPSSSFMTPS